MENYAANQALKITREECEAKEERLEDRRITCDALTLDRNQLDSVVKKQERHIDNLKFDLNGAIKVANEAEARIEAY